MVQHLGFREVIPDQFSFINWRQITGATGGAQSTLQDIKVPEYGGSYVYKHTCPATRHRTIFWRVFHDVVELWEENLDADFVNNHIQLRFTDTPVLEGFSVHETNQHIVFLLATVSSVHHIRLPHPRLAQGSKTVTSIFSDLTNQSLKENHNIHILNSATTGDGLPHTAATHLVSGDSANSEALFVLCQSAGTLLIVRMTSLPYAVHTHVLKNASFINRIFTGFVPGMFRGMEGGETVTSVALHEVVGDTIALAVCRDGRIRAWSCARQECILAYDALENTAEAGHKMTPGAQRHLIRIHSNGERSFIAIFLSFAEKQMIIIYSPVVNDNMDHLTLKHIETFYPPQFDLVDMTVTTSYVWTLWTDSYNNVQLMYAPVHGTSSSITEGQGLTTAVLEDPPDKEVILSDMTLDPQEIYLKQLFAPNRFSPLTLRKALGIYKRNNDVQLLQQQQDSDGTGGMYHLADEVIAALRDEVEARLDSDFSDEEVVQVTLEAWATFYSHTLQYHQVGQKAVAIVNVDGGGLVGILRKQSMSWVRPIDAIELLLLAPQENISIAALADTPVMSEDASVGAAVIALTQPLRTLRAALDPEVAAAFRLDLLHHHSPDQVASGVATSLLTGGELGSDIGGSLRSRLGQQLTATTGLIGGLRGYLRALRLDLGNPDGLSIDVLMNGNNTLNLSTPAWITGSFGGKLGAAILAAVVGQFASVRLDLCRDLLLLQHIALQLDQLCHLQPSDAGKLRSTLVPQTTLLTQAYFAFMKVSTAPATLPPTTLEASRQQLAILSLTDSTNYTDVSTVRSATALELFIRASGGKYGWALVASSLALDSPSSISWSELLMSLATTISQLAWPISRCMLLVEFLVWGGQHEAAQEYIRLLQPWCEWNSSSRKFLLAVSLLNQGEARKATRLFLSASEGVATEDFLDVRVAGLGPDSTPEEARMQYYLKVIRLLEQSGHIDLALEVAEAGVAQAPPGDPGLAALYSVSFKYHLDLGHHNEAFTALLACPDQHRRRNCLRQLVVTLYDRKALDTLVNYQYGSLETEVVTILENRARSADILINNYYDLLFAFHVRKHNYKKAASVMYECGLRLNIEGIGEAGLRQQAKCYLACLNCLSHIPSDHAWILKPIPKTPNHSEVQSDESEAKDDRLGHSKRDSEGTSVKVPSGRRRAQVEVLELADIEREYQLVHSRLKLHKTQSEGTRPSGGPISPADTIGLLTHGKLFRDAVHIARLFKQPVAPILQGLASVCVQADASEDRMENWNWLSENGMQRDSGDNSGWWSLLRQILEEEEKGEKQSHLHQAVATSLLQCSTLLPAWFVQSYKRRNTGELLQLYVNHGHLEDSVQLACDYIDAVLGRGTDQVGLSNALHSSAPPVWLPYTSLDHLVLELKENRQNTHFNKLYGVLSTKITKYQTELKRVSQDREILMQR